MEERDWEEELQLRRDAMALWAAMVAERNLPSQFLDVASANAIEEALKGLTHVRLDREHILLLEPAFFLCLRNLTSLYLQEVLYLLAIYWKVDSCVYLLKNELTTLNGIETARQLQFLAVSGNNLTSLQGVQALPKLAFLDASNNSITSIDPELELPKSLMFLNISQNQCCKAQTGLENKLRTALPNLRELRMRSPRAGSGHSSTSDEENSLDSLPDTHDDLFLNVLEQSLESLSSTPSQPTGANDLKRLFMMPVSLPLRRKVTSTSFEM